MYADTFILITLNLIYLFFLFKYYVNIDLLAAQLNLDTPSKLRAIGSGPTI